MLGKTAGGLFWMFRYLERSENTARLLDAGFRLAITRTTAAESEWASLISTAAVRDAYLERHGEIEAARVIDFLLRDPANPSSVMAMIEAARNNARLVRTALTREVWEATNECWMALGNLLARPVAAKNLPDALGQIRQQATLVRGALHGSMLRNDGYNFARVGTFIERADNTARILDVKYYVLLPAVSQVGSTLDNVQWETILRSVSGLRAYRWIYGGEVNSTGIASFVVLDRQMPRSLVFCLAKIVDNLGHLAREYGERMPSHDLADARLDALRGDTIESIFDFGLHEYIDEFLHDVNALGAQIERDYRFIE